MARIQFRDEIVAKACAYLNDGYTLRRIQRELENDFPNEETPDFVTIHGWTKRPELQDKLAEMLIPQEMRLAAATGRIFESKLEDVERGEEDISMAQAAVNFGIVRDKVLKRAERRSDDLREMLLAAIAGYVQQLQGEPIVPTVLIEAPRGEAERAAASPFDICCDDEVEG